MRFVVKQEKAGKIEIQLYNMRGERVAALKSDAPAGINVLEWQCRSTAPGIYLVRMHTAARDITFKVAVK
jgi:hypothetical protein